MYCCLLIFDSYSFLCELFSFVYFSCMNHMCVLLVQTSACCIWSNKDKLLWIDDEDSLTAVCDVGHQRAAADYMTTLYFVLKESLLGWSVALSRKQCGHYIMNNFMIYSLKIFCFSSNGLYAAETHSDWAAPPRSFVSPRGCTNKLCDTSVSVWTHNVRVTEQSGGGMSLLTWAAGHNRECWTETEVHLGRAVIQ